ncbi:hypothetical protein F2Q68_00046677 [Brassica cretica]|uniref:Anaphase-promoting complex subunit 6 n=1 Tax=Brassica cretica TaxID=69181 RepID=A0A8S9LML6_BRACR|nr:hypothetical protein F2Q68_00046677 [Brassica cretica]
MKARSLALLPPRRGSRDCVSKHLYSSAIFLADKVAALTNDPADIYLQAQALFLGRHYRRAFHLLNASNIVLRYLRFHYLAAKCLEWDQCLLMLGDAKVDEDGNVYDAKDGNLIYFDKDGEDREINMISSAICFLRGKAYGALQNRSQARQWYKAAIKADPLCYEALECLIESHMLTSEEVSESNLLSSLQFSPEDGWLSSFYSCLIKKYDKESTVEARFKKLDNEISGCVSGSSMISTLVNNTDLLACKAEYYHQCCQYQKCFELTSRLLEKDPFHLKCTLVHLAAAMELGNSNELYLMACNLISSAICFLRGKAYGALQNRSQARQWYKAAIKADPLCYEALECLIESHMLTSEEESNLLSSLQFSPEDGWLSSFYSCLIKKYDKESTVEARFKKLENEISGSVSGSSMISTLVNNTDLLACKAEYYHQCCQYQKCFELTSGLLEKDPFHLKCTLVHLAAAMELGNSNELYLMACNLVKDYPSK